MLASILAFGFLLRILPILWGVPVDACVRDFHPDEEKILSSLAGFPGIYGSTSPFPVYGTSIQYLVGALLFPVKFIVLNVLAMPTADYRLIAKVAARAISVGLGVSSIYLTYALSTALFDRTTALVSALFLSTSLFHVMNSPLATLDVATGFLLLLNILCCIRAVKTRASIHFAALGVAAGVLVGTKLPLGLFFVIPLLLLAFDRRDAPGPAGEADAGGGKAGSAVVRLAITCTVALLVYLALNPQVLIDPMKMVAFYAKAKQDWGDRLAGSLPEMFRTWVEGTARATGAWVGILGLVGMVLAGRKRRVLKLALVTFLLLYYALFRWSLLPRYVIAIAPLICMFAGNACAALIRMDGKAFRIAGMAAAGFVAAWSAAGCVAGIADRLGDTRPAAASFMLERIPPGATVGVCGTSEDYPWTIHAWMYPKIDGNRFRLTGFLDGPEYLVVNRDAAEPVLAALKSGKVSPDYRLYEPYRREWYAYSPPSPRIFRFYEDLLEKKTGAYRLVADFSRRRAVPIEFPSPEILIFRRVSPPETSLRF